MRRIVIWLFSTVAAVVLLFSYRTSTDAAAQPVAAVSAATDPSDPSAKIYTGTTAPTRWGDVQVKITVANGTITDVAVPVYPHGNGRDQEINANALPQLVQETLKAQSASIATVSGATVTSDGYLQSLQSALDAAHLG